MGELRIKTVSYVALRLSVQKHSSLKNSQTGTHFQHFSSFLPTPESKSSFHLLHLCLMIDRGSHENQVGWQWMRCWSRSTPIREHVNVRAPNCVTLNTLLNHEGYMKPYHSTNRLINSGGKLWHLAKFTREWPLVT